MRAMWTRGITGLFALATCGILCAALTSVVVPAESGDATSDRPLASDPAISDPAIDGDSFSTDDSHWAYQPLSSSPPPKFVSREWARNPVDAFIAARLESKSLAPTPEADKRTLIRRAAIDVLGLPPTPDEVAEFLADERPDAYERMIDRLLASPRFGERWARHWLDLARYAESDGYKADVLREGAWRYRDYVIRALNSDKPYDRFIAEQLAGDELWPESADALIATGFLRHWAYEDNGRDLDRQWQAILNDVTDVTGQVFLGMTIRCARCHDHKFDAILQRDYFRFQAFFAAMRPVNDLPVGPPDALAGRSEQLARWEEATAELRREREKLEAPYIVRMQKEMGGVFPPHIQQMIEIEPEQRTPYQRQLVVLAGEMLRVDRAKMSEVMPEDVRNQWEELNARIAEFDSLRPGELPPGRGVRDIGREAAPVYVGGDPKEDCVEPGYPSVFDDAPAAIAPIRDNAATTGRRTTLARWIADERNPLTPRVAVNRAWQHLFGSGIVPTSGDFGVIGDWPSHPELLDWLAADFVRSGLSTKHTCRRILNSAAYRQQSLVANDDPALAADPHNELVSRHPIRRLDAEVMRDAMLAASGELNTAMGGESVLPELPEGLSGRYGWKPTPGDAQQSRRSIYLIVKRNVNLPLLSAFDVPDSHEVCARRVETTTPTQALILLNDDWPLARARAMADRVLRTTVTNARTEADAAADDSANGAVDAATRADASDAVDLRALVARATELAFSRPTSDHETSLGVAFLKEQAQVIADRRAAGKPIADPPHIPSGIDPNLAAALVDYCHVLLSANEFLYCD